MSPPTRIKLALDWTPNTLHSGLYLAQSQGFYASAGLTVDLLPPSPDYTTTPAKQLERGAVDLAVVPSESCVAYAESGKMKLQAVYAVCQQDASAVVAMSTATGVERVRELGEGEGKVYGSYNARYEDAIVRAMVAGDGGKGEGMRVDGGKGKLGLFEELKRGGVDATWVFMPWEGVEAEMEGVGLRVFKMEDYGVPYGYSPVVARDASSAGGLSDEVLKKFVTATRKGYELAVQAPEEAVEALSKHCSPPRSKEFLEKSQQAINGFYGGEGSLGSMRAEKWETWVRWLKDQGLLKDEGVDAKELFTNAFFADD